MAHQKLLVFWVWMLLLSSLCPWTDCRRGGGGRGLGKGVGLPARAPPSQSKQGLKMAGAAAAGALGGAAIGYGLSSMGRSRYSHGHSGYSDQSDGLGHLNQSMTSYSNSGSLRRAPHVLVTLAAAAHIFIRP